MRTKSTMLGLVALVFMLIPVYAQEAQAPVKPNSPVVTITGPKAIQTGSAALFFTEGTTAKNLICKVEPVDDSVTMVELPVYRGDDNGTPIIEYVVAITFGKAGNYLVIIAGGLGDSPGLATQWVAVSGEVVPIPDPTPSPDNPYTASADYKATCLPLSKFSLEREDATALAALYGDLATELLGGGSTIKTSDGLRQVLIERGKKLGLQGKYAGLSDAMEAVLSSSLTLEIYEIDPTKAANLLNTIAWAVWESGNSTGTKKTKTGATK